MEWGSCQGYYHVKACTIVGRGGCKVFLQGISEFRVLKFLPGAKGRYYINLRTLGRGNCGILLLMHNAVG